MQGVGAWHRVGLSKKESDIPAVSRRYGAGDGFTSHHIFFWVLPREKND
jgi:hypothetical protein